MIGAAWLLGLLVYGQGPWRLSAEAQPSHARPGETCRFVLTVAAPTTARPTVRCADPAFPPGLKPARACIQTEEMVGSEYRCRLAWDLTATATGTLTIPPVQVEVSPGSGPPTALVSAPLTVVCRDDPPPAVLDNRQGWLLAGLSACLLAGAAAVLVWLKRAEAGRPLPGQALAPVDPQSPGGRLLAALKQAAARRNRLGEAGYLAALAGAAREFAQRHCGRELLTTADVREAAADADWAPAILALLEATDAARFARETLDDEQLEALLRGLEAAARMA